MTSPKSISELQLDRLTVQELSPKESQQLEHQLQDDEQLQQRMDVRDQRFAEAEEREDFDAYFQATLHKFQQLPTPEATAPQKERQQQSLWDQLMGMFLQWQTMGALTAAAIVVILVLPQLRQAGTDGAPDGGTQWIDGTTKGGGAKVQLLYLLKGQSSSQVARSRLVLHPGDVIQFTYAVRQKAAHVLVASLNPKGVASPVISADEQSKRLTSGKGQFPSLELDDELGQEKLFVFVSDKAFAWTTVQAKLQQAFQKAQGDLNKLGPIAGPWKVQSYLLVRQARSQR